ncbi:ribonuclease H-like protein [Peniophora sp. CONT]|nr:ribonuclease H-like protein [Peniophora sp. CONT]
MAGRLGRSHTTNDATKAQPTPLYTIATRSPIPEIVYARSVEELDAALKGFHGPYGFDCEWKCMPQDGRVALVQLANGSRVVLAQVSAMSGFPAKLKTILEDPSVVKIGQALEGDGARLRDDYGINVKNLVNIHAIAQRVDRPFKDKYSWRRTPPSLALIVEHFLGCTLSKDLVRLSNWERSPLTVAQREYAAGDAHCVIELYQLFLDRAASNHIDLSNCGKVVNFKKPYFEPNFPFMRTGFPSALNVYESAAYTMWDLGYSATDILSSMQRHCRSDTARPSDEAAVIALIVGELTKKPSLSYDPTTLRALVEGNPLASKAHEGFLADRCPVPSTSHKRLPSAASGSRCTISERPKSSRDSAPEQTSSSASQCSTTAKRSQEERTRETTPEEAPRKRTNKRAAPSPEPEKRVVKRSRTAKF